MPHFSTLRTTGNLDVIPGPTALFAGSACDEAADRSGMTKNQDCRNGWNQAKKNTGYPGGGGASTSRVPLCCGADTTPSASICSIRRAARL
jgi:hypothetical protein